jgi:hypothetical protein
VFRFVLWNQKQKKLGLFRVVSVFRTYIETNRTVSIHTKITQNFLTNTKICSLSNCFVWSSVCFSSPPSFGLEAKQPKQTVSKQTKTNENKPKNLKFSDKYQNMLSIKLVWFVFCLFRFNRNIKTLSFGIEAKQLKQTVLKQTKQTKKNPKFF